MLICRKVNTKYREGELAELGSMYVFVGVCTDISFLYLFFSRNIENNKLTLINSVSFQKESLV